MNIAFIGIGRHAWLEATKSFHCNYTRKYKNASPLRAHAETAVLELRVRDCIRRHPSAASGCLLAIVESFAIVGSCFER